MSSTSPDDGVHEMVDAAQSFVRRVYPQHPNWTAAGLGTRPHVTLTFAQSVDAKVAGPEKKQLALSGRESMLMTHCLRTVHDGILVGVGTLTNDNPQLNARLLPTPPPPSSLPRPIVLDTHARTPPSCKLLANYRAGIGARPIVVCPSPSTEDKSASTANDEAKSEEERKQALRDAGAQVLEVESNRKGDLDWPAILQALRQSGITRLMIEGGASVIQSLLSASSPSSNPPGSPLVDTLIVTVAPILVGPQGVAYEGVLPAAAAGEAATTSSTTTTALPTRFNHVTSQLFGKDVVFAWHGSHLGADN